MRHTGLNAADWCSILKGLSLLQIVSLVIADSAQYAVRTSP
jgi:hypothetical protein